MGDVNDRIVADPADLRAYAGEAAGLVEALELRTAALAASLDAFRASDTRPVAVPNQPAGTGRGGR